MDFFEAQARAKKRTGRLVVLFALAVVGTILVGYLLAILFLLKSGARSNPVQPDTLAAVAIGTLVVVSLGAAFKWLRYRAGGAAVAESVGARRVETNTTDLDQRRLLNVVEEMSIASGLPVPAVYIVDDEPGINAFAAGLTTNDAVVTVTSGALQKLNRDELQGVIGHEFSHILNGDMRLNMRIGALVFGILVIGLAGRGILQGIGRGRVRVSGRGKGAGGAIVVVLAVGLALMIVGYTGYFYGRLIQAAVSRQREFLADASSVQFTRNPGGIVNALRKIGGYALGSSMQSSRSAEIGHFFFAQAFKSNFGGLWATHPPLDDRIRAVDPQFDGKFFEPEQVIDVTTQSWDHRERVKNISGDASKAFAAGANIPFRPPPPPKLSLRKPAAIVASAGTMTTEHLQNAGSLLDSIPDSLRNAARAPDSAMALTYGLLLAKLPSLRARQVGLVRQQAGDAPASALAAMEPDLLRLDPAARLPLLQLALPALRSLSPDALGQYFGVLDELVHADKSVSPFEFALQKLILHALAVGRPDANVVQIYSFNAVVNEINVVLSVIARAGAAAKDEAGPAFEAGAAEIRMLTGRLSLLHAEDADFVKLDAALDKLATASPAIKQGLLLAAAHTASSDGVVQPEETELLRAIAATLDVPIPA